MRPFNRLDAPEFLYENWEQWGDEYASKKTSNPSHRFNWKQYRGQLVNQHLQPILQQQTQRHCSYCDAHLLDQSIDHFQPKGDARYYRFVYQWENLYLACGHCQKAKMDQFNELLLRPDAPGYAFERYFIFNFSTGEIEVNPAAADADKLRAEISINLFGFNLEGQQFARQREIKPYGGQVFDSRDDYAYRFIFD